MGYSLKTLVISILWIALMLGITYVHTGFNNDALDEKYGEIAGYGAFTIWMFAAALWFKRKSN